MMCIRRVAQVSFLFALSFGVLSGLCTCHKPLSIEQETGDRKLNHLTSLSILESIQPHIRYQAKHVLRLHTHIHDCEQIYARTADVPEHTCCLPTVCALSKLSSVCKARRRRIPGIASSPQRPRARHSDRSVFHSSQLRTCFTTAKYRSII